MKKYILLLISLGINLINALDNQKTDLSFTDDEMQKLNDDEQSAVVDQDEEVENDTRFKRQPKIQRKIMDRDFFSIHFADWSTEITNPDQLEINIRDMKRILPDYPSWKILIVGNAGRDANGIFFEDNLIISLRRAQKVREELIIGGIDPNRIEIIGIGYQEATVDPKEGTEAQAADRRADIYVIL